MNFSKLQKQVWQTADDNGFHKDDDGGFENHSRVNERLMLVVTEVSELREAINNNDPNNLKEELSDISIRILDILECYGMNAGSLMCMSDNYTINLSECLLDIIDLLLTACELVRKGYFVLIEEKLRSALLLVMRICIVHNINLESEIIRKDKINQGRGPMHGGKKC